MGATIGGGGIAGGLLRRIARPAPPAEAPVTPARALRLAATRAAQASVGLPVSVLGIAEEEGPLDELLARLEEGLMLRGLDRAGSPAGLIGLDREGRAAAVEAQVLGRPAPRPAEDRPPTAADAALCEPLLAACLAQAAEAAAATPLGPWLDGAGLGARLPSVREAALALPDGVYRALRLTLDLGAGGRQGLLVLLLREPRPPAPEAPPAPRETLAAPVLGAGVPLRAVLHRLRLPLAEVEGWEAGQVVALPGVTVASVRVLGPGGADLGAARLGQVAGRRAIRLEAPLAPRLQELRPPGPD